MRHLLTAFACFFAMSLSAQTGFVEFPYNPDSDNDDMIGTEDLLGLLSLYGSEFSEEGLYLSTDSTDALYHIGEMYYSQCFKSCNDLPGNWHIPSRDEMYKHDLASLASSSLCFIQSDVNGYNSIAANDYRTMYVGYTGGNQHYNGGMTTDSFQTQRQCYCAAHERPNVEYAFCNGAWELMLECAEEKTELGWYPLGHISPEGTPGHFAQAFWRWAE